MEITDKSKLKVGDLIWFHNWGVGGFLFGVVMELEEEDYYHNKMGIWRARSRFSINDVDGITLIEKIEDVKNYALHDFEDFLNDVKEYGVFCNFSF